jgi:hypothetical protein
MQTQSIMQRNATTALTLVNICAWAHAVTVAVIRIAG